MPDYDHLPNEELRRGSTGADVRKLYDYLKRFGYFPNDDLAHFAAWQPALAEAPADPGAFDETLEQAVRLYQGQNGLVADGVVGPRTLERIRTPRCGNPDVVHPAGPQAFTVSGARWNDTDLRYHFDNLGADLPAGDVRAAVRGAFDRWTTVTPLNFAEVDGDSEIQIGFFAGDHGDGATNAFDGPSNVLAHCFYPPPRGGDFPGDCHFDEAETWTVDTPATGIDLLSVALHELGHGLGLEHSAVTSAVMFATYNSPRRELTPDDIAGIRAIYGGWRHGVPSAGQVGVAPGSTPTSWYTTPEDVEHIAYVGTDGQVHELYFFVGRDTAWRHGVPSTGQVPVMPGTSPTSWYTTPEDVEHIAYVGTDGMVHELYFFVGVDTAWRHGVPSAGQVPVMPGTSPTSWYTTPENVEHIAYVGTDGQIHELYFFVGVDTAWRHGVPSASQVPVMPGTSPTSWYTTPENVQHIAYVGTDAQVHELYFFVGVDAAWRHGVPSAGQEPVAPGTSPTSWYTTPENVEHIGYVGSDKQVHELYFFVGRDTAWRHGVPSAGQIPVAPGTSPTSWYTTPENVEHIGYVGTDAQVHELYFFVGQDTAWRHGVPSAGQAPVAPGTSPTSWYTTPENVEHIGYVGTDGQVHELYFFIR